MLNVSLKAEGLLDPAKLQAWTAEQQKKIFQGVKVAMTEEGKVLADRAKVQARSAFPKGTAKVASSIRSKVFSARTDKLPDLLIGSKIPWLGIHERGGTISGKMLIPFGQHGGKRFAEMVARLMAAGNAYFRNVRGTVILFAKNLPENRGLLQPALRRYRKALGGGRVKEVPIAVLVSRVVIRKRLHLEQIVRAGLPALAQRIEQRIGIRG